MHEPANSLEAHIRTLAEAALETDAMFLVDVAVRGQRGSRQIDVFVDADDGVNVDACAALSRRLGDELEERDLVKGRYNLNVSSPGVDRPLVPRQFPRHVGRPLRVIQRSVEEEQVTVEGTLDAVGDDGFTLKMDSGETVEIPFDTVERANVVLPW